MEELRTDDAPAPLGPYSQGTLDGDRIFVSGQGPIDPETGEMVDGDAAAQADRVLKNAEAILAAADAGFEDVVKTTVFLTDMADYEAVNEVYAEYMTDPYPARSCVAVRDLPGDIDVEIQLIARRP